MSPRDLDSQIVVRRLVLMDDLLATLAQLDATGPTTLVGS